MSNTKRNIPGWVRNRNKSFIEDLERGHVDIPKADPTCHGDEIWGQGGKKYRKKMLARALRRSRFNSIEDQSK